MASKTLKIDTGLYNYNSDQFIKIWKKRTALKKSWNGSDPKPAFNYEDILTDVTTANIQFQQTNWNDPALFDFRKMLDDISFNETITIGNVTITYLNIDGDEKRYIIQNEYDVYVLSQYKNRGKIQSFIATEYGEQIDIFAFTQLLIDLKLEK